MCYLASFGLHSANFLTSRSCLFFYFISSSLFSVRFRILLLYVVLPRHVSCKCGGHFWSRVEKTIAETGIGFRNFEMEADSHVLNRVFRNSKHKFRTSSIRYSIKLYVLNLRIILTYVRETDRYYGDCPFLCYYASSSGKFLPMFRHNLSGPSSMVKKLLAFDS